MRRVVVSGIGLISPLAIGLEENLSAIRDGQSAVRRITAWDEYQGLRTRLGAAVELPVVLRNETSKAVRSMGRTALLATAATEQALEQAGLLESSLFSSGRVGIAYGSGTGSTQAMSHACNFLYHKTTKGLTGTTYHQMMSHTCAANIGIYFGIRGRIIPTSSACTSGSLAIGYATEQIRYGKQDVMIAGGAEEFAASIAAIFDVLFACSVKNDTPQLTPRPFDTARDGMVVAEGACSFILEEREHALARGVLPLAEVVGFGSNSDGYHITAPLQETIEAAMQLALDDAGISAAELGYINAHATGTPVGDITESLATARVLGSKTPISSLKGHLGHMLGASGAVEAALTIGMMNQGWCCPTRNLEQVDARCAELNYVMSDARELDAEFAMSNTFAFGGINSSLIFKKSF